MRFTWKEEKGTTPSRQTAANLNSTSKEGCVRLSQLRLLWQWCIWSVWPFFCVRVISSLGSWLTMACSVSTSKRVTHPHNSWWGEDMVREEVRDAGFQMVTRNTTVIVYNEVLLLDIILKRRLSVHLLLLSWKPTGKTSLFCCGDDVEWINIGLGWGLGVVVTEVYILSICTWWFALKTKPDTILQCFF